MTRIAPLQEADFQEQVTDLAEQLGYGWVHFRAAETRHGWRTPVQGPLGKGWPDLVLIHDRRKRVVFAELKREGQEAEPEQLVVLELLRRAGAEAYLWWPHDLEQIAEVLR
jgi:hypothetical protein